MSEFSFEGGTRGGPNFVEHLADRKAGLPRVNASLSNSYDPWPERHNQNTSALHPRTPEDPLAHGVVPLGHDGPVDLESGAEPRWEPTTARVFRVESNGLGTRGTGFLGNVPHASVVDLVRSGASEQDKRVAEAKLKKDFEGVWGGGRYRVSSSVYGDYDVFVSGLSKEAAVTLVPDLEDLDLEIGVGATVWLELSREGPYKVVGRYDQPAGAIVPAHHPHDAPNTFEKIRVTEGLWLCQDVKGVVHILAEGSLTTRPPASRFNLLSQAGAWCWGKREFVLWAALAGTIARLAL